LASESRLSLRECLGDSKLEVEDLFVPFLDKAGGGDMYLGRASSGFFNKNPLKPAAFSPRVPKP
jgi:hypothetical protein